MTTKTKTSAQKRARSPGKKRSTKNRATQSAFVVAGLRVVRVGNETRLALRKQLNMPRSVFMRLVNVSERAIADAETGKPVKKLVRPYNEIKRLFEALSEVVEPEAIGPWFLAPNEKFEGSRPIDLVERGEIDRLWRMVYRLRAGIPG